jgi:signal transduction histidine kinase
MDFRKSILGYVVIAAAASLLGYAIHIYAWRDFAALREQYVARSENEAYVASQKVDLALSTIYDSLRTIASLPGIRGAGRHAESIAPETKAMVQQVYNNLAAGVAVSEVYVSPASFAPERADAVTGAAEAPIIMFDQMVLNAGANLTDDQRASDPDTVTALPNHGPEEVEIDEYRVIAKQIAWFRERYPERDKVRGLHVPLLSSSEVITCDNSTFITTRADRDRKGVVLSVPFYAPDGRLAGTVSAIILSNALRALLPNDNYVLVNAGSGFTTSMVSPPPHVAGAKGFIVRGQPDPSLIFSAVVPVGSAEAVSPWQVWAGRPDAAFLGGPEMAGIRSMQLNGYLLVLGLAIAGMLIWTVIQRDFARSAAMNRSLAAARDEALKAEHDARSMAEEVNAMNSRMAMLNRDLQANMERLAEAQEEILRKGKLAHLGQLTATVAHEIRNPLAAVRTSAFLLKRKTRDLNIGIAPQIERIENGITRCDAIITQLLDFARNSAAQTTPQDLDEWLAKVVSEEAKALPRAVAIELDLGCGKAVAHFDMARLQRAVINLIANASEALVGKGDDPAKFATAEPMILVSSRRTPRGFEIDVADNGPGIAPDLMKKIFEPLFTTKSFGTGLGIPAVEKIMEQHGGRIEAASVPGQGARFTLVFPGTAGAIAA